MSPFTTDYRMDPQARLDRAAVYLSLVQFLFATSWVVYVIYLGELLDRVGIGRDYFIWFIILDQAVFAISDTLMGYAADKVERLIGNLGPRIIAVNFVSCLAFALLPFSSDLVNEEISPILFTLLLVIWIATSSVLRAPPLVLLTKHAARPKTPRLAALSLLGLALGGALAPYIGLLLKGVDPAVPFVLSAATLVLVTLGISHVGRIARSLPAQDRQPRANHPPINRTAIAFLLFSMLFIGFGFQIHVFLNSKPLYQDFVAKDQLVLVLPLFWVGFKLLALPAAAAARRYGSVTILTLATLLGGGALLWVAAADSLETLIAAQMLAGGAWGVVFTTGVSTALGLGTSGREGLVLGLLFTMLSLAALTRAGLVAGGIKASPEYLPVLHSAPGALWFLGSLALLGLVYVTRKKRL